MVEDSTLAAITESHLFRSLDDAGRAMLLQAATVVNFSAGQAIVREGDPGEALYLIKRGAVRVETERGGQTILLAELGPGACFGEVALLSGRPRTATVVAVEPCVLLCFQRTHIDEILALYPRLRQLLETVVVSRAQDTIDKITRATM